jgi:hypothetical protein
MSLLNECDFAIPTYPFSGTNSKIYLIRLDKPTLFILDQSDLAAGLSDYNAWYSVNFLNGLCESSNALVKKAAE